MLWCIVYAPPATKPPTIQPNDFKPLYVPAMFLLFLPISVISSCIIGT